MTSPHRRILVAIGALLAFGCRDHPGILGPDTVPPRLRVVFPTASDPRFGATFDRDSNGLLDLELTWSDSLGRVDPASLRIVAVGGVPGAPAESNLAFGWRRVRVDSAGAAFEETIPLLLRSGQTTLRLSVADSAGNPVSDSVVVALPPASFHRIINLNYRPEWPQERAANLVLLSDGSKGAVPFLGGRIAVFDPDGVFPTRYVEGVPNVNWAAGVSLDPATGSAFVGGGGGPTNGVTEFSLVTEQVLRETDVGAGVASVFVQGQRVYVGEACTTGRIIVLDRATLAEVGRVEPGFPVTGGLCNNSQVRSTTSDGLVGWALTANDLGIMSLDLASLAVLQHRDIRPPSGDADFGSARDVRVLQDRYLYLARLAEGVDEVDLSSNTIRHYSGASDPSIREFAVSPDRSLLFVSASAGASGPDVFLGKPLLFDVPGLRLRWELPARSGIFDAAVWHSDGKRVYVMVEYNVAVYIVRPR